MLSCAWCGPGRSDLAASTRLRLEDAARKKDEEAREKAGQRFTRQEYKCVLGFRSMVYAALVPCPCVLHLVVTQSPLQVSIAT